MVDIPVTPCPDVTTVTLPNKAVSTFDGKTVKRGLTLYFRFAPRRATQYVVLASQAVRTKGGHQIVVLGPRGVIAGMDPLDFVADKQLWWEFHQKRNGATNGSANGQRDRN